MCHSDLPILLSISSFLSHRAVIVLSVSELQYLQAENLFSGCQCFVFCRYLQSNHFDSTCKVIIKSKGCEMIRILQNEREQKPTTKINWDFILLLKFWFQAMGHWLEHQQMLFVQELQSSMDMDSLSWNFSGTLKLILNFCLFNPLTHLIKKNSNANC